MRNPMDIRTTLTRLNTYTGNPQTVFRFSLLIAGFCTICYTLFLTDIYRDTAHAYAPYVREIANGNWAAGIASQVPMLNISLAGLFAITGLEPVRALTLVAGLFFLASCFPLRSLLERYVSPLAAAWGCVLFVIAPKMIRFACAPLLESSRMFFMITAILFFLRTVENPKWKNAVLFGISCGLMAVSRGEGILLSVVLLFGLPVYAGLFCRPAQWGKLLAMWATAIVCAGAAISPFCAMNCYRTGYFVPDVRIVAIINPQAVVKQSDNRQTEERFVHQSDIQKMKFSEKAYHNVSSFIRGGYELYWVLAIIGAAVIFRKKEWKNDYLVLYGTALLYFLLYMMTVSAYRYYIFLIPLFMMFTVTGAGVLRDLAVKYLPYKVQIICIAVCVALGIGQITNGVARAFSSKGKDFIKVGKWIGEYNKKYFPERKLKLYSPMMSEVA